ncbi:hypothetical protein P153DRAFT_285091 [Dothidotthia symphoricarpi CBS 119687]|uniref:Uncharacterized protein n=1 Tax=Dothidotthia symphoricarpi CBS 119687 TaxID=1392245 RepID=A0A6A6AJT0_9PLEO|nr:uncharacterized protein P153DRAFT_285091 [Dothidotthia symphoricarpi CBS 119687]KAF2132209.1 hypothetical protein P153DRAFT_285091 [Dothidotthia symphoricarpi CBS 119687]
MPVSAPTTSLSLRGHTSDVEKSKRRSLLPQPGQSKYSSRSSDSTTTVVPESNVQTAIPGRLRPRSLYQSTPSERAGHGDKQPTTRSMRPPSLVNKSSESQPVGLNRTQSLRRPGVAVKSSQPPAATSHSRTRSTSTVPAPRTDATRPRTYAERPKSLMTAPNFSSKTNGASTDVAPAVTRTSARLAGLTRSASTKAGPSSVAGAGTISKSEDRRREPANEEPRKTARPAFSTLQQHFTPRKTGKAPTSTFLHPAPAPGPQTLPPEIVSLQSELLQLHLLHESCAQISKSWELSAKRCLHNKFEEVASMYQAMLEYERAGQEQNNLRALLEWSAATSSAGLPAHMQSLSGPLHDLPSLVAPGGRLHRLAADFEHWLSWVQDVRSARKSPLGSPNASVSLAGLGDEWTAEAAALARKLTSFARDLEGLMTPPPAPGSSIACIVLACSELLDGLLDELQTMQKIEAQVVGREKNWVEQRLQGIARGVGAEFLVGGDVDVVTWRT